MSITNETYTLNIKLEDVYEEGILNSVPPSGYTFGEFRPPKRNETFLSRDASNRAEKVTFDFSPYSPRIILNPVPRQRFTFETTGEFRPAKHDEYVLVGKPPVFEILKWVGGQTYSSYPIVRLVEVKEIAGTETAE